MRLPRGAWLALCLLILCFAARAQEARSRTSVVELNQAGFVSLRAEAREVAPVSRQVAWPLLFTPQYFLDDNNVVHRVLVDKAGTFVFGYDLIIKPLGDKRQFEVAVRPLSPDFEERLRRRQGDNAPRARLGLNLPTLPATEAQILDDGDAFALDLLVNPQLGIKIVDVVKLSFDRARLVERSSTPPRDFTLDKVEMAVKDFRLYINGTEVTAQNVKRDCEGALVWFYVTGQGRFIFSLIPRPGYAFEKSAVVEDNKISFSMDGNYYEWESSEPIVPGGGEWNLWVMREDDYDLPEIFAAPPDKKKASDINVAERPGAWREPSAAPVNTSSYSPATQKPKTSWWKRPLRLLIRIGGSDRLENLLLKAIRNPLP
jgi:hypothetical protein